MSYQERERLAACQQAVREAQQIMRGEVWDKRFLDVAALISTWSKDPSTKVGCVVVGPHREIRSTGFNGFPRGIDDTDARLNDRETKYPLIVHAEENAVAHAARIGQNLMDCTAYVTSPTCPRCARLLIQAGVCRVVYPNKPVVPGSWEDRAAAEIQISRDMLAEASVAFVAA